MTTTTRTRVTSHVRHNKNGGTTRVRQHARRVSVADLIQRATQGSNTAQVTLGAVAATGGLALCWTLQAVFSLVTALMITITMVCLTIVGLALKKPARGRRKSWLRRRLSKRFGGVLSPRKRLRLWAHKTRRKATNSLLGRVGLQVKQGRLTSKKRRQGFKKN